MGHLDNIGDSCSIVHIEPSILPLACWFRSCVQVMFGHWGVSLRLTCYVSKHVSNNVKMTDYCNRFLIVLPTCNNYTVICKSHTGILSVCSMEYVCITPSTHIPILCVFMLFEHACKPTCMISKLLFLHLFAFPHLTTITRAIVSVALGVLRTIKQIGHSIV